MKKFTVLLFLFSLLFISSNSFTSVLQAKEEFQARLLEPSTGEYKAMKLIISVESYTSAQEVIQLIEIYNEGGYEQMRRALREMNKGDVQPTGGRGLKIILHAAQKIPTDDGSRILVVAEGQSWKLIDPSVRYDSRFPFLFIELKFDSGGNGTGRVYPHADIKLTDQGIIEIASFFTPPIPLYDVSALK
jgi:hypothetical protein